MIASPDDTVDEPDVALPSSHQSPRHAVARGLRQPRSEPQLTQLLAAVLGAESGLASQFVRIVIDASPGSRFKKELPIPDDLVCRAEEVTDLGRFDLSFQSPSEACAVVVELKIHADFAPSQIARYRQALAVSTTGTRVLVAITRDTPRYGVAPTHRGPPAWLGCVAWAQILADLRKLRIHDAMLADQWLSVLDVLEEEGAMGFTRAERQYFDAWLHQRRAVQHLKDFVDALRVPVRDGVRSMVCPDLDAPQWSEAADLERRSGSGVIVDRSGPHRIYASLKIPSRERTQVQFGVGSWDDIYLFVELSRLPTSSTRQAASPEVQALVGRLAALGFKLSNPKRPVRATRNITPEHLRAPDLPRDAAEWIVGRISDAYAAGALTTHEVPQAG